MDVMTPKIWVVMGEEPLFSFEWLSSVFGRLPIGAVFVQPGFANSRRLMQFVLMISRADVVPCAWRIARWLGGSRRIRAACRQFGVHHQEIDDVNSPEFLALCRWSEVDLLISFNGTQKWQEGILSVPRLGCINIHLGLLPDYRGLAPVVHALAQGESTVSVTVHTMTEELDAGSVLGSSSLSVAEATRGTILGLHEQLTANSVGVLENALLPATASYLKNTPDSLQPTTPLRGTPTAAQVLCAKSKLRKLRRQRREIGGR